MSAVRPGRATACRIVTIRGVRRSAEPRVYTSPRAPVKHPGASACTGGTRGPIIFALQAVPSRSLTIPNPQRAPAAGGSMRRLLIGILAAVLFTPTAQAQSLRDHFSRLFTFGNCGQPLCLDVDNQHGDHFIPQVVQGESNMLRRTAPRSWTTPRPPDPAATPAPRPDRVAGRPQQRARLPAAPRSARPGPRRPAARPRPPNRRFSGPAGPPALRPAPPRPPHHRRSAAAARLRRPPGFGLRQAPRPGRPPVDRRPPFRHAGSAAPGRPDPRPAARPRPDRT